MSTIAIDRLPPDVRSHPPMVTTMDASRGSGGMWLFVATETSLFVMFFFAYFYLAEGGFTWPRQPLPPLIFSVPMLALLLISSGVLYMGERQLRSGNYRAARLAMVATGVIGLGWLALQSFEYKNDLLRFTPQTDVYGSLFYTITGFHIAHLILGILMLVYVLILPRLEPVGKPPHRPYHNASIYWHFVVFIWFWTVMFLYVTPYMR